MYFFHGSHGQDVSGAGVADGPDTAVRARQLGEYEPELGPGGIYGPARYGLDSPRGRWTGLVRGRAESSCRGVGADWPVVATSRARG